MDPSQEPELVPVEQAQERVLARIAPLAPIELPLSEGFGCILAQDAASSADLPPFASSAMDGFAVRSNDVATASTESPVFLRVIGKALVGRRPEDVIGFGEAVRIATGAPIPTGADCIVPIEYADPTDDTVQIFRPSPLGKHIRPAGEDVRSGELLVPAGRKLGSPELGLLAAAGMSRAVVHPRPRVVIISTGDELIEPGKPLEFGQIYDSNAYLLMGALKEAGAQAFHAGAVRDDPGALKEQVLAHLATADAFITSGGVSVGESDPVKAAFLGRGEIDFYRVAMRPGMPQAFGMIEGKPFFGLPGNPVSVFVSFEVFVRPALMKMAAHKHLFRPQVTARLDGELSGLPSKTVFERVLVKRGDGGWVATPTGGSGSNLIATVARANALAVVPAGAGPLLAGSGCRVMVFRAMED